MMEGQNTGLLECSGMGSFYSITCPRIGPVRLVIRQANSGPTSAECRSRYAQDLMQQDPLIPPMHYTKLPCHGAISSCQCLGNFDAVGAACKLPKPCTSGNKYHVQGSCFTAILGGRSNSSTILIKGGSQEVGNNSLPILNDRCFYQKIKNARCITPSH